MIKGQLLAGLNKVEKIACSSKLSRLFLNPYKYIDAIFFRKFTYARNHQEKIVRAKLFFGDDITIALPAATDIYLTGGKSHDSEIRLARFLVNNLNENDHFLDIGAHYGYFTLLAAKLTGPDGKICAFEPARASFEILKTNCSINTAITCVNKAVSDTNNDLVFYQFPNMYSEYNSMDVQQFEQEEWFKDNKPEKIVIPALNLDTIIREYSIVPKIIKIDVEGAEDKVIKGGAGFFTGSQKVYLVMEYLSSERGNDAHQVATRQLQSWGYNSFVISGAGDLEPVNDISSYLQQAKLESDNIVFVK
ncbi:FkbM family methyltransferase [Chitinophagaceae bacterium MMS25-I14]